MNIALIFAGGIGRRMHSKDRPKQFLELYNKPILVYTIEHFQNHPDIDKIVLVTVAGWESYTAKVIKQYSLSKVEKIVLGGETGQLSIYNGLCAAKALSQSSEDIVLIHDGVRPLINAQIISDNIRAVKEFGSAVTSVPAIESIVAIDENMNVNNVINREQAMIARAPQSFKLEEILACHECALKDNKNDFIDSCMLMHTYQNKSLHLVKGPIENIKITTPEDFYIMRAIVEARENKQLYIID